MARVFDQALNRRVGRELRRVRMLRRQPLTQAAAAIGCSYQQLQKYERGQNAVPLAALIALGAYLGFDPVALLDRAIGPRGPDTGPPLDVDLSAEALHLAAGFDALPRGRARRAVREVVAAFVDAAVEAAAATQQK